MIAGVTISIPPQHERGPESFKVPNRLERTVFVPIANGVVKCWSIPASHRTISSMVGPCATIVDDSSWCYYFNTITT